MVQFYHKGSLEVNEGGHEILHSGETGFYRWTRFYFCSLTILVSNLTYDQGAFEISSEDAIVWIGCQRGDRLLIVA